MQIKTIIVAENIIRDFDTNRISAINIFDAIDVQAFPIFIPNIFVLIISERKKSEGEEFKVEIVLTFGNKNILNQTLPIDFQNKLIHRAILSVQGLTIPEPGILDCTAKISDSVEEKVTVHINSSPKVELKK